MGSRKEIKDNEFRVSVIAEAPDHPYLPMIEGVHGPLTHRGRKPMHRHVLSVSATLAVAALLAIAAASPATARIECRGNFQITQHGPIATPYCEEEEIARVARSYGMRVTGAEVHRDPLKKVYLCQTIGGDSRLRGSCAGYGPERYR